MSFLIEGNAQTIYSAFGHIGFVNSTKSNGNLEIDISRTQFFGTTEECQFHREVWSNLSEEARNSYTQGNMSAGNLYLLFGNSPFLDLEKQDQETERAGLSNVCFAYVDEQKVPSGFLLYYRKDNPKQWILALTKHNHLPPEERQVSILTSFDPRPFCHTPCKISQVNAKQTFSQSIDSPKLEAFFKKLINSRGQINPHADVIEQFLQYVSTSPNFMENEELLEFFHWNLATILDNEILNYVQRFGFRLTPRQLVDCLDSDSKLSQLIRELQSLNERNEKQQLQILLKLDELNLNDRQAIIRSDEHFVNKLCSLFGKVRLTAEMFALLSLCLSDEQNTKALKFLSQSNNFFASCLELIPIMETEALAKLDFLATQDWQFPRDNFRHAVICQVILKLPSISNEALLALSGQLSTSTVLEQVFIPTELGKYLILKGESQLIEQLLVVDRYFNELLKRYEPQTKELTQAIGARYLANPQDTLLSQIHFCKSVEQINACYTLDELGFEPESLSAYVLNPVFLSAIKLLSNSGLAPCIKEIITEKNNEPMLEGIHQLGELSRQKAALILFAHHQLEVDEIAKLVEFFNAFPKLAALVINLYEKNFSIEHLKQFIFDPDLHRGIQLLSRLNLEFSFEQLTPFIRQIIIMLTELLEANEPERDKKIDDYLTAIWPSIWKYLNQEEKLKTCLAAIQEHRALITGASEKSTRLVAELAELLTEQLSISELANEIEIPQQQQLMKTRAIARELARALQLLQALIPEEELKCQQVTLYQHVFASFSSLVIDSPIGANTTKWAVEAMMTCYFQELKEPLLPLLLQKPALARAILKLQDCDLAAISLLEIAEPLRDEIASSLIRLSKIAPGQASYQLALQKNQDGHDFRRLIASIPILPKPQPFLAELLYKGIQERRLKVDYENIGRQVKDKPSKNLACNLDASLILINRLRALSVEEQVIDFITQDTEKSQLFCKTVLRVEAECQAMRLRLKKEAREKYNLVISPERDYRKALYEAFYEELNLADSEDIEQKKMRLQAKISQAEAPITNIVNIDRHPELRTAMMIIANILTLTLTFGVANFAHQYYSGDFLFFARPKSAETIQSLGLKVLNDALAVS